MAVLEAHLWAGAYIVVATAAFVLALMVMAGYVRLVRSRGGMVKAFAWAHVLAFGAYAIRAIYWLVRPVIAAEDPVSHLARMATPNLWLDLAVVAGAYFALRAIWWMVPPDERGRWAWYTAWLYPPARWVDRLRQRLRHLLCENGMRS